MKYNIPEIKMTEVDIDFQKIYDYITMKETDCDIEDICNDFGSNFYYYMEEVFNIEIDNGFLGKIPDELSTLDLYYFDMLDKITSDFYEWLKENTCNSTSKEHVNLYNK